MTVIDTYDAIAHQNTCRVKQLVKDWYMSDLSLHELTPVDHRCSAFITVAQNEFSYCDQEFCVGDEVIINADTLDMEHWHSRK